MILRLLLLALLALIVWTIWRGARAALQTPRRDEPATAMQPCHYCGVYVPAAQLRDQTCARCRG